MLAIMNGHVDCVHLLLEKGSTADAADKRGRTALHRGVSASLGVPGALQLLLSCLLHGGCLEDKQVVPIATRVLGEIAQFLF